MTYPLPGHHFRVEWGGERIGFASVEGLEQDVEVIAYREGSFPSEHPILVPGLRSPSTLVLRRGIMAGDGEFQAWLGTVRVGTAERRDLTISLLNAEHEPVAVWKVRKAWPCRLEGPEMDAMESEIAIETLVLAHEGITAEFS